MGGQPRTIAPPEVRRCSRGSPTRTFTSLRPKKAPIAQGLMWATLAAALLKRYLAHATQMIFEGVETSTRRTAMAIPHILSELLVALLRGFRGIRAAFRRTVEFLSRQARRAHPKRDRKSGRLHPGLCPVHRGRLRKYQLVKEREKNANCRFSGPLTPGFHEH